MAKCSNAPKGRQRDKLIMPHFFLSEVIVLEEKKNSPKVLCEQNTFLKFILK